MLRIMVSCTSDPWQVAQRDGRVVIEFPAEKPALDLRSPKRGERFASWLALVFVLVGLPFTAICAALSLLEKGMKLSPLQSRIDLLLLICFILGVIACAALFAPLVALATVGPFQRRTSIEMGLTRIVKRTRQGFWKSQRTINVADVRHFVVQPPRGPGLKDEVPQAMVTAHAGDRPRSRVILAERMSHADARRLANRLAAELAALLDAAGQWDAVRPGVADTLDEAFLAADQGQRPACSHIDFHNTTAGLRVVQVAQPLGVRRWFRELRLGLWLASPASIALLPRFVPELKFPPQPLWGVVLIFVGFALSYFALVLWAQFRRKEFLVTADGLEIRTGLPTRRRHWPRQNVAAITVVQRLKGDPQRHEPVLELRDFSGKREDIAFGDVFTLKYLATLLRQALGVPARPAVPLVPPDPTDPQWHLQDQPDPPRRSRTFFERTDDGDVVVRRRAEGYSANVRGRFFFFAVFLAVCLIMAAFVAPQFDDPDTRRVITFFAASFALLATGCALALWYQAVDRWTWVVGPQHLRFTRQTLFGTDQRQWAREALAAIGTRPLLATIPTTPVSLVVTDKNRRRVTVLNGAADEMRYLATVLREAVGVPAAVEENATIFETQIRTPG